MATLTIRMPDDKAERLKQLAAHRGVSVNKLIEEWTAMGISEFDCESRFVARAAQGSRARGLEMLAELDRRDQDAARRRNMLHDHDQAPYKGETER